MSYRSFWANEIVGKFDAEFGTSERELDFVYFLEGNEKERKASVRGISQFRAAYKRPKWDIVQE
jgi:hypothetical protein